jgi:hypothetical protein
MLSAGHLEIPNDVLNTKLTFAFCTLHIAHLVCLQKPDLVLGPEKMAMTGSVTLGRPHTRPEARPALPGTFGTHHHLDQGGEKRPSRGITGGKKAPQKVWTSS